MFGAEQAEELDGLAGWVVDVVDSVGEVGVGALIFLESVVPPIPSEVVLPFAGFSSSQGDLNVVLAWLAATVGAVAGALLLYGVGALVGYERLVELSEKRWFLLFGEKDLVRGERFFERHGGAIVFFGRCIPLVRSIVSVPAGVARMPLVRFTVLTAVGSGIWNAVFIWTGRELGDRWERVEGWVTPAAYTVVALLLLALVVLIVRRLRQVSV